MSATNRSGAVTGPGRLRITAIASATTSTIASATSISLTFSQKPLDTGPKLSSNPVIEKNDSTTLFTPGESAIRATTSAKKTTVLTVEMTAFRRWERLRASPREPPGGPASPAGKPRGSTRVSKPIPMSDGSYYCNSGRSSVPRNHLACSRSIVPFAFSFRIVSFTCWRSGLPFSNRAPYCSFVVN
jgi:hypothetical protein